MSFHDLLTYVSFSLTFATLSSWVAFVSHVVVPTRHLLHLNIHWLLAINLGHEAVHTLRQAFCNLAWHFRYHINYLFLSLKCLWVSFDDVENVKIFNLAICSLVHAPHYSKRLLLSRLGMNWVNRLLHLLLQQSTFVVAVVSPKWIDGKLGLVNVLMSINLTTNTLTQVNPLVLLLIILLLHIINVFLLNQVLTWKNLQVLPKLLYFCFLLANFLLQLILLLLKVTDAYFELLLPLIELLFNLVYLDVYHLVFLYLCNQFFLSESQIFIYTLKFFFHLAYLLAVVAREKARAKVSTLRLLAGLFCLPLALKLLQRLDTLSQSLIV